MMFSTEKCASGSQSPAQIFGGGDGDAVVPVEEVASAASAGSDEIGEILKDELGDVDREDRIGVQLAELSIELDLLASYADGEGQPSLLEIAMNHRESVSGSSTSSTWSGPRSAKSRRLHRIRPNRPRALAKGKETRRKCRRPSSPRPALGSDASDVGADTDSDDQWTELDEPCSSETSSVKGVTVVEVTDCNGFQHQQEAEAPPMGQFLLPLLSAETEVPTTSEQFHIRHEDILQLLASAEDGVHRSLPRDEDVSAQQSVEPVENMETSEDCPQPQDSKPLEKQHLEDKHLEKPSLKEKAFKAVQHLEDNHVLGDERASEACQPPVEDPLPDMTPEQQATLLHYICEEWRSVNVMWTWCGPLVQGMFHWWCENAALMNTISSPILYGGHTHGEHCNHGNHDTCGSNEKGHDHDHGHGHDHDHGQVAQGDPPGVDHEEEDWIYRAYFSCHCHFCMTCVVTPVHIFIRGFLAALVYSGEKTQRDALVIMHALRLNACELNNADAITDTTLWNVNAVRKLSCEGAAIVYHRLEALCRKNTVSREIINRVCACRPISCPLTKENALDRFCAILHTYQACTFFNYRVEILEEIDGDIVLSEEKTQGLEVHLRGQERMKSRDIILLMANAITTSATQADITYLCDCMMPKSLCAAQRQTLLRLTFIGFLQTSNQLYKIKIDDTKSAKMDKRKKAALRRVSGTGAKPPDVRDMEAFSSTDEYTESDCESGNSDFEFPTEDSHYTEPQQYTKDMLIAAYNSLQPDHQRSPDLWRTVRSLIRSIASIEYLMDKVLRRCTEWTATGYRNHEDIKIQIDKGLLAVDRKLTDIYRRIPDVYRRQMRLYKKQARVCFVCKQLVGIPLPLPPPPVLPSRPSTSHRALCSEHHLARFTEVRRRIIHMRDQQMYNLRLRSYIHERLKNLYENDPSENSITLVEVKENPIKKSQKCVNSNKRNKTRQFSKPQKHGKRDDKTEVETQQVFKYNNIQTQGSDSKGRSDSYDMVDDFIYRFANVEIKDEDKKSKIAESISPPLELSPITENAPQYNPNSRVPSNCLINKNIINENVKKQLFSSTSSKACSFQSGNPVLDQLHDPAIILDATARNIAIYKYVTFGLEVKKALADCQTIIDIYNKFAEQKINIVCKPAKDYKKENTEDIGEIYDLNKGVLVIDQICEVMMNLEQDETEFLNKIETDNEEDDDEDDSDNTENEQLQFNEFVQYMPQFLAKMPEIAKKLSAHLPEFNYSFPEFKSLVSSMPEINEAQLTPETLKQIRELKLNKTRDSVKVTKNTSKRKSSRKVRATVDNEIVGAMTFEIDGKDFSEAIQNEKDFDAMVKNLAGKEDFKDLLFSISAQVVINRVFDYLKQNKNADLSKCFEEEQEFIALTKSNINSEVFAKVCGLFEHLVKDSFNMQELMQNCRYAAWKFCVANKTPREHLYKEMEDILTKYCAYIHSLAFKQTDDEIDKLFKKCDDLLNKHKLSKDKDAPETEDIKYINNNLDSIIMKISVLAQEKKNYSVKNFKFRYSEVVMSCYECPKLACWVVSSPDLAATIIADMCGLQYKRRDSIPDFATATHELKVNYFANRIRNLNRNYMSSLPKDGLSIQEWLIMIYQQQQLEDRAKEALLKLNTAAPKPAPTPNNSHVSETSEAEILAGKGLSKIISKANAKNIKKPETKPKVDEKLKEPPKTEPCDEAESQAEIDKKIENEVLLATCEAILAAKGSKTLLESFYAIKTYITQGLPVPEPYKQHVPAICACIDAGLLEHENNAKTGDGKDGYKIPKCYQGEDPNNGPNTELGAKFSSQTLRNVSQSMSAKAFKTMVRNVSRTKRKSESDANETTRTECKWSKDCICPNCKQNGSCSKDPTQKQINEAENKQTKANLEDKKVKEKSGSPQIKLQPKGQLKGKMCENVPHQHICKGHAASPCINDGGHHINSGNGQDPPCTCSYCTVFGQAPQNTTPVPRNYNETRERLLSILNKKKQKSQNAQSEHRIEEIVEKKPGTPTGSETPPPTVQPVVPNKQKPLSVNNVNINNNINNKPIPQKTTPPNFTAQQKAQETTEAQQNLITEKMAKMAVSETQDPPKPKIAQKPAVQQTSTSVQTVTPPPDKPLPEPLPQKPTQTVQQPQQPQAIKPQQQPQPQPQTKQQTKPQPPRPSPQKQQQQPLTLQQQQQLQQQRIQRQLQQQHLEQQIQQQQLFQQQQLKELQEQQLIQQQLLQQQKIHHDQYHIQHQHQHHSQQHQHQLHQHQQHQHQQHQHQQHQHQQHQHQQHQHQQQQQQHQQHQQQQHQQQQHEQLEQHQHQQHQHQHQQHQQQRNSRAPTKGAMVTSSRDSSVFSTSSEESDETRSEDHSRPRHIEDTRDLDALLQYIEGPTRHVDRGKKRAKKQRQKAKKMELTLVQQRTATLTHVCLLQHAVQEMRAYHRKMAKSLDYARNKFSQLQPLRKKGKKPKVVSQKQEKIQEVAEELREFTKQFNTYTDEIKLTEKTLCEFKENLKNIDNGLREVRAIQSSNKGGELTAQDEEQMLQHERLIQSQIMKNAPLNATLETSSEGVIRIRRIAEAFAEQSTTNEQGLLCNPPRLETTSEGMIRICRMPDGFIDTETLENNQEPAKQIPTEVRRQSWEAALAHIMQLANDDPKEKKKSKDKEAKTEAKQPATKAGTPVPNPETVPPLSKKQRKLLAKQQAEEEEQKKQQEIAKKKAEGKTKVIPDYRKDAKRVIEIVKPAENVASNKKGGKEDKKTKKADKKQKDNKQEITPTPPPVTKQQQLQPIAKNNKKKPQNEKPQSNNTAADTTPVNDALQGGFPMTEKPASCSIMEQLSCGVQVADLRLPPGITLTRVHPNEKKEPPPIKSVPVWKGNSLSSAPTPVAQPPPFINADPNLMTFSTAQPEPPKPSIIIPDLTQTKAKKGKKKNKNRQEETPPLVKKPEAPKMVTLRNPMFHPNLPPVQISTPTTNASVKTATVINNNNNNNNSNNNNNNNNTMPNNNSNTRPQEIPQNPCQATITPISNGMYTIRNPYMSLMHQQSMVSSPPVNPIYTQTTPQFGPNFVNPNTYSTNPSAYVIDPSRSPKPDQVNQNINPNSHINLASFTQKNDEGYSLFNTTEEKPRFLTREDYFVDDSNNYAKPTVSPNPIGTRPVGNNTNNVANNPKTVYGKSEPTKVEQEVPKENAGFYTPFGLEDKFRSALFSDKTNEPVVEEPNRSDSLPYFQRLRVGSQLNSEVTIHHVNESRFYKPASEQNPIEISVLPKPEQENSSMFSSWGDAPEDGTGFGAIGSHARNGVRPQMYYPGRREMTRDVIPEGPQILHNENSVFAPDRNIKNLNDLDTTERDIESFKRFDYYFNPPKNKPKINFNIQDISRPIDK